MSTKQGMVYADHDFCFNYFNAVGGKDQFMQRDILIDEIAKLIFDDSYKKLLVNILRENGYNISMKDKPERISNIVSDQIKRNNQAIIDDITNLISIKNGVKEYNFSSDGILDSIKSIYSDNKDAANSSIAEGISSAFQNNKTGDSQAILKERVKQAQMAEASTKNLNKNGMSSVLKWSLIGGGIIAVSLALILIIRFRNKRSTGIGSHDIEAIK